MNAKSENFCGKDITFSKNVFIPLTNFCRNRCGYCGFRSDGGWVMEPDEVFSLAEKAASSGCSEALITLGERPEVYPEVKRKLEDLGFKDIVEYLEYLCRKILRMGLLPHTNAGLLTKDELRRLRKWSASMGLMLETIVAVPSHRLSPGKDPAKRLRMIEEAGRLKIPFTTGLLIGIGETQEDRLKSILRLREINWRFGHIQELIIQPFAPKLKTPMEKARPPSLKEILEVISVAKTLMPGVSVQVPPNLLWNGGKELELAILSGADDLGGISPVTPDFINPEHPWPKIESIRRVVKRIGGRLRERLPIYPMFALNREFISREVWKSVRMLADKDGFRKG